jgi:hypothetical protein
LRTMPFSLVGVGGVVNVDVSVRCGWMAGIEFGEKLLWCLGMGVYIVLG